MQVISIEFNAENNRFVIVVSNSDFLDSDALLIGYNFAEYVSNTSMGETRLTTGTISFKQAGSYEVVDDKTYYYYPINVMGVYSNIYVQVIRPGTVPSNAVQTGDVDLQLFSFGAGTTENPYRIASATQLLNIKHFTSANYVLTASVNMSEVNISERLSTYNAIVSKEFSGTIDGNNYSIFGFNVDELNNLDTISLENVTNFALFETLNGATIKNLTFGEENIQLILFNTFAKSTSDVINLSLIATGANNSTIENIKVLDLKIVLTADSSITKSSGEINIAGLINDITNTTITNATINLEINIEMKVSTSVEINAGGVSATATTSNIGEMNINFNLATHSENYITYVGGAIGYYIGNSAKTKGLTSVIVNMNMSDVNAIHFGGLVGFARYIKINSCETKGTYSKSNIDYSTFIGGLLGYVQSSTISNSGSFINFALSVSNNSGGQYIGALAGMITVHQSVACEVIDCYSNVYVQGQEKSTVTISEIVIGMYGNATSTNVEITGCYKKEQ